MYAKIASTQYEDVDKFVATAIKEMKDRHGLPKEKIESGKTRDSRSYFVNEYPATKNYSQWERVAAFNFPELSPTLFSHPGTRRAIGKIPAPCKKC
jgi:hypothetical protein